MRRFLDDRSSPSQARKRKGRDQRSQESPQQDVPNPIRARAVGWEIRERQRAEEALRESEERFRNTFEQAAVGIAHVSPDGHFLRINQRFCDIVGYSPEEMLQKTFGEITHPDDLEVDRYPRS